MHLIISLFAVCCVALAARSSHAFVVLPTSKQSRPSLTKTRYAKDSDLDKDRKLYEIAKRLKLEVYDIDVAAYGLESQDPKYGLEVVKTKVKIDGGLGLILTEMAGNSDGRGLVLVSDVSGNAAQANPPILIGDVITGLIASGTFRERTTELNYDLTVEAINRAKDSSTDGTLTLEIDRLVERNKIQVALVDPSGSVQTIDGLAGENLRRLLLRRGAKLYDSITKRFDMPFATGDCAGEGLCGTCLVNILSGQEMLNTPVDQEQYITKGRPSSWRASCRTIVGADNKAGTLRVSVHPQTDFENELNPGVRSVSRK
jgi:ferredoxin